jgi:membrane protein
MGAALAYYTVFSLAPLLLIAIGIASAVFGEEAAGGKIVEQIEQTVGTPAARAIQEMLKHTHESSGHALPTVVGILVLLFGASGVFVELQDALNTVWKVKPELGQGLLPWLRDRLMSFSVVLGTGFLLLVSLVVSAALSALNNFLTPASLPGGVYLWQGVNLLVSFAFITLLFGVIFKLLPDAPVAWRDVWVGAAVTALLFTLGKYLLGLYLGRSGTTSAFGAAGSLVLLLLWVYYSSQILLFRRRVHLRSLQARGSQGRPFWRRGGCRLQVRGRNARGTILTGARNGTATGLPAGRECRRDAQRRTLCDVTPREPHLEPRMAKPLRSGRRSSPPRWTGGHALLRRELSGRMEIGPEPRDRRRPRGGAIAAHGTARRFPAGRLPRRGVRRQPGNVRLPLDH